jgi:hypothetical protein
MNLQLFILSVTLNIPIFFLCRYFIIDKLISNYAMNWILTGITILIIIEHAWLFQQTLSRNISRLNKVFYSTVYINSMIFVYLFYMSIALAAVIYYPSFPSSIGLFIIIFVLHYLLLTAIISVFIAFLVRYGFRYNLQQPEKVKNFLKGLSLKHNHSAKDSEGENRLSLIEVDALDNVFKKMIYKELKIELKCILFSLLLLWSRLFSLINAIILSLLLVFVTYNF